MGRLHDQAVGCVYIGAGWPVATSSVPARPQGWTDLNYSAVAVEVRSKATACSAACRDGGSVFPRFSARRRIPAHAVPLKKYRCGIEPVSSTCDNEHTAASLGQSEILGVQGPPSDCSRGSIHSTSVRPLPPWRLKRVIFSGKPSQKAPECVVFRAENAGDVFPENDCGLVSATAPNMVNCICDFHECDGQVAALVRERFAQAGNAECLAGRAAAEHVRGFDFASQQAARNGGHVAEVRHIGVMVGKDGGRERLNFSEPSSRPAKRLKSDRSGFDSGAD